MLRAALGLFLAALLLSACGGSRFGDGKPSSRFQGTSRASSTVTVSGRDIVIEGPRGFCVDRDSTEIAGDSAFVLLASCRAVNGFAGGSAPSVQALLTASIAAPDPNGATVAGGVQQMEQFFRSENGRTALSRDADPGTVEVMETFHQDGIYYLRARDTSQGVVPGASHDYWRAYFDLQDQIVSVSVIGFESAPLSPSVGLSTTQEFARLIRSRNGPGRAPLEDVEEETLPEDNATEEESTTEDQPATRTPLFKRKKRDSGLRSIGILRRIF